jgi:hypothetical protein
MNDLDFTLSGKVAPFPRQQYLKYISRLTIQSKDMGRVPFRLLGSQRYLLDELCAGLDEGITEFLVVKNRQCGSTTFFISVDMFWAFKYHGLLGAFVLHKEEARDDWRTTIEIFYDDIPRKTQLDGRVMRFKPEIVHHNRNVLSFKNGSRFRYLIAGTAENRKGGLGRSGASNFTHMTECAFYGNAEDVAAYRSSTSSIYPHRLTIMETTGNGFNWFEEEWREAKDSKTKRCIFVGWWRDERNRFPTDHPFYKYFMPDHRITALERERIRAVKSEYGFDITLQQLAWYRWHLREQKNNDQALMDQEVPWTADDASRSRRRAASTSTRPISPKPYASPAIRRCRCTATRWATAGRRSRSTLSITAKQNSESGRVHRNTATTSSPAIQPTVHRTPPTRTSSRCGEPTPMALSR